MRHSSCRRFECFVDINASCVKFFDLITDQLTDNVVKYIDTDVATLRHFGYPCTEKRDIPLIGTMPVLPPTPLKGNWVQTERAAHEAWANLIDKAPKAARLMHILTARVGEHNAVVVSQKTLAELMECSRRTIQRALDVLVADRWIEIRQIGESGTVNAHIINDRVAWSGPREGIRYSLFSASVILSEKEQPDSGELGRQEALRKLPSLFRDERQLPTGEGLPPPSQPMFEGIEPDLPATRKDEGGAQ